MNKETFELMTEKIDAIANNLGHDLTIDDTVEDVFVDEYTEKFGWNIHLGWKGIITISNDDLNTGKLSFDTSLSNDEVAVATLIIYKQLEALDIDLRIYECYTTVWDDDGNMIDMIWDR